MQTLSDIRIMVGGPKQPALHHLHREQGLCSRNTNKTF